MKRDVQATEAAEFKDPRSYITPDGREVLYLADWSKRVRELRKRSGGRCEFVDDKGVRCRNRSGRDPHHLVKRSKLRDDRLSNLSDRCRQHHQHPEFETRWTKRTP